MIVSDFLIVVIAALVGWLLLRRLLLFRKMAPGPYGLPIVGSMIHLMRNNPVDELHKYKEKFGKVFSVTVGNFYVTVVSDYRLIIDAMKREELQGRPNFGLWEMRNLGDRRRGVLMSDGPVWSEQRRFALRNLRDFGFGKESMEGMIIHELQELQNELRKELGQPFSLAGCFNASVLNSLWSIVTGKRFELKDPVLNQLIMLLNTNVQATIITTPALFFFTPMKIVDTMLGGKNLIQKYGVFFGQVRERFAAVINEHLESFKEGQQRDFVDAYIQQIRDSSEGSSFFKEEGLNNLQVILLDLFIAGAETTSTTLQWGILYLCHNPEVQKKVQAEIDEVIGRSRPPQKADKPKLIYMEAVMNEIHRMASLLPYSVFHRAQRESEIGGHYIPRDSVIFFSIRDCHHDKEVWGDPEKFRPERFLDETGNKIVRHEAFMPFSTGKRQCLGETLARDSLFIFFTGLLQAFTFKLDPDSKTNDLKGTPSLASSPKPFKVIISERI